MPDIMHLLKIGVSKEKVYEALITAEGIRSWWTRDADLNEKVGEFRFGAYGSGYSTNVRVDELAANTKVSWTVTRSFRKEWEGTKIAFDLRDDGGKTILAFSHRGFPEADDNYAMCTTGWGYYLVSLQQYLESGQGAPSPDVDWARVVRR